MERVVLNIVTGLLGSGKTSVLRHLLGDQMPGLRLAVVIGEFAEQGLDAELLPGNTVVRQISQMGQGDAAKSYLTPLRELVFSGDYNRIYLETSGVTEIHRLVADLFADPDLMANVVLGPTVTVLDAGGFDLHTEYFGNQLWAQVDVADVLIINKTDMADAALLDRIEGEVRLRYPKITIQRTYMGQMRRGYVNSPLEEDFSARILSRAADGPLANEFESFVYRSKLLTFDRVMFGHRLLNLPVGRIARFKGKLKCWDKTRVVNGFPGRLDWDNAPVTGGTAIAFIGLDLMEHKAEICGILDKELEGQQEDVGRKVPLPSARKRPVRK